MRIEIVKIKLRRLIARYLSDFVYLVYSFRFKLLNLKEKPPVIILTPGKVGSSSVYYTLKKNLTENSIFHIHYLSEDGIKKSKINHLKSDRKSLPLHLMVSELLYKKLKSYNGKIKIITIIREPISRSLSSFFQNINFYKKTIENDNLTVNETIALKIIQKDIINSVKSIDQWLLSELLNNFDVDIYSQEFPKENRYVIFKNTNIELLLLKMEDMNDVFNKSTKDFFRKTNGIILEKHNVGEAKYYSDQYIKIKRNIKLDDTILTNIISSNYFNHFYKEDTIAIIKKFSKNKN